MFKYHETIKLIFVYVNRYRRKRAQGGALNEFGTKIVFQPS